MRLIKARRGQDAPSSGHGRYGARLGLLLFLLILAATESLAEPWRPGPCNPSRDPRASRRESYEARIRALKPGSPGYVPKPFPRQPSEAVIDFKFRYRLIHPDSYHVSKLEKPLYTSIVSDGVTYRVERIENWTTTRCLGDQRNDFHFALVLTDSTTRKESLRVVLRESGQLDGLDHRLADRPFPPPIAEFAREVAADYGLPVENGRFVESWGTVSCEATRPCFAFESKGRNYVLEKDNLFAFDASKQVPPMAAASPSFNARVVGALLNQDLRLLTLANEGWAIAERVPRPRR